MKIDYSRFMGSAQFGPAYQKMLDNDTHAPGSVDGVTLHCFSPLVG